MRLQERLLRGPWAGAVERGAARHAAHREDLQLEAFAAEFGVRLVPVNLRLAPGCVAGLVGNWRAA
jgi:hypothetical protein